MELSKKSWLNKYLHWILFCTDRVTYNSWKGMPKSLCSYFWISLIILLLSPILIPLRVFSNISGVFREGSVFTNYMSCVLGILASLMLLGAGGGTAIELFNVDTETLTTLGFIGYSILGSICLMLMVGIILGCVVGAFYIGDVIKDKKRNKKPNIVGEFVKAKKDKVCPIIEYK